MSSASSISHKSSLARNCRLTLNLAFPMAASHLCDKLLKSRDKCELPANCKDFSNSPSSIGIRGETPQFKI